MTRKHVDEKRFIVYTRDVSNNIAASRFLLQSITSRYDAIPNRPDNL